MLSIIKLSISFFLGSPHPWNFIFLNTAYHIILCITFTYSVISFDCRYITKERKINERVSRNNNKNQNSINKQNKRQSTNNNNLYKNYYI